MWRKHSFLLQPNCEKKEQKCKELSSSVDDVTTVPQYVASFPGPIFILKLWGQKIFRPHNFNIKIGPGNEATQ